MCIPHRIGFADHVHLCHGCFARILDRQVQLPPVHDKHVKNVLHNLCFCCWRRNASEAHGTAYSPPDPALPSLHLRIVACVFHSGLCARLTCTGFM